MYAQLLRLFVTTHYLSAGVGMLYMGAELGPFLPQAYAYELIKGPALLCGALHCHIGKGS